MAREFAKAFYNSKEWQAVRSFVLMRDKYLCVKCGCPAEEVHHINHLNESNIYDREVNLNPANLVSLCRNCHFEQHKQDKIFGKQQKKKEQMKKMDDEYPFYFDENGMLQEKKKA